jgi:hypothetical protein
VGGFGRCNAKTRLSPACSNQRTFRLIGINVDEADMDPGKGLAGLHAHGVVDHPLAGGQVAAVPPREGAGDFDILDGIVVAVAQRESDQGL